MEKPHSAKSRGPARNFRGIVTFSDSISPDTLRLNLGTSRCLVETAWVLTWFAGDFRGGEGQFRFSVFIQDP